MASATRIRRIRSCKAWHRFAGREVRREDPWVRLALGRSLRGASAHGIRKRGEQCQSVMDMTSNHVYSLLQQHRLRSCSDVHRPHSPVVFISDSVDHLTATVKRPEIPMRMGTARSEQRLRWSPVLGYFIPPIDLDNCLLLDRLHRANACQSSIARVVPTRYRIATYSGASGDFAPMLRMIL